MERISGSRLYQLIRRRPVLTALIVAAGFYLLAFIPPDVAGTKDPNLLATHHLDEYIQFPNVIRMTSLGQSPAETLSNIFVYRHYFYGYPFFLISALAILPARLAFSLVESTHSTLAYMLILREQSSLFILLAILLLVYLWNGFKSTWFSAGLFAFLAFIPGVISNNMVWHPDSLATLFVVLTIFSLSRDNLKFGNWFYLAAVFAGLAAGTKVIGLFFFLTIAVYLVWGNGGLARGIGRLVKQGALFAMVMAATIIVSNPLLLIPSTAREIVETLTWQSEMNSFGWGIAMPRGPLAWYDETLRLFFGNWWIYALALAGCLLGIVLDREKRLLNVLILTWSISLSVYLLFFVGHKAEQYFIPALIPFLSCLANPILWRLDRYVPRIRWAALGIAAAVFLLCAGQFLDYAPLSTGLYQYISARETERPALDFYARFEQTYFADHDPNAGLTIARDLNVYVPPLKQYSVVERKIGEGALWNYTDLNALHPDVLLLQTSFIDEGTDLKLVENASDPVQAQRSYELYLDAKHGSIRGYRKILETDFAVAFERALSH